MTQRAGSPWSPRVGGFLVAEAISAIGSFATMVAIWAFAAYKYDASAGEISLYGVAFSLPGMILGPIGGVVVDRFGQRPVLLMAKALGVVASLALLTANSFTELTLLSALHGVANTFARPALTSLPPRMVDDEYLARTNALVGLTEQLSIVLGPVAAGVAIALFGFKGAFIFDAATYALGIAVLPLVHLRAVPHDPLLAAPHPLRDAFAGWGIVWRTPVVRRVVLATFTVHALYGTAMLAEPLYVRDVLQRSPNVFSALQTMFGLLLVLGGVIAARKGDRLANFRTVATCVAASGATAIVYLTTGSIVIAFVGAAAWGLFTGFIGGPSVTVLQRNTDEGAHGRVMATDMLAGNTAIFLGMGLGGLLIEALGVRSWILLLGTAVVVSGAALLAAEMRSDRPVEELPEQAGVPG
ncbi:MAG TPA: MFS transporter [Acidimicrobiales bacterium]|nr:MFS transporter [Acidimicrobiales bacterium]